MLAFIAVITCLIFIAVLYFMFAYIISGTIVFLNRQPSPKNPSDYGMDFENIEYETSDAVNIKGWLIPGTKNKLIIITHVGGLTKYGSTTHYKNLTKLYNKEIQFLKTAQHLHQEGYWVIMFDFRNHGESGADPNKGMSGVGLEEYKDVVATMHFIESRKDLKDMDIGFMSFCMGANSTIIAMSREPEVFFKVKCLFAVQPISMEVFIRTYSSVLLTKFGSKLLMPMVKKFIVCRGAHPIEEMSPKKYTGDLKIPTIYVQARNDPWTNPGDIQSFFDNTPDNPREFFWIENTSHRFDSYKYFEDNPEKMLEWFHKWL